MKRVALCIRKTYLSLIGGDSIQVMKTKEYLEKGFDVSCEIITEPQEISKGFDIVHVFNYSLSKNMKQFMAVAKEKRIPIVSSSIYWDYSFASISYFYKLFNYRLALTERNAKIVMHFAKAIALLTNRPKGLSRRLKRDIDFFMRESDVISPNSIEEGQLLCKFSGVDYNAICDKIKVVVNATDEVSTSSIVDVCAKYSLPKDYVVQVGRVEFIKNQLNLLLALKDNPEIPIVFVGRHVDEKYSKLLKSIASKRGNVYFIDNVPHDEIYSFYHYAKVHVLMSLRESPGLVSLEALQAGCRIVISDERFVPIDTYFSGITSFCSPFDVNQIKEAVIAEYNEKTPAYKLKGQFTWGEAARQTYDIYTSLYL